MTGPERTRWSDAHSNVAAEEYAARFAQLADSGADVHGEADLVSWLAPAEAKILDAGCGTGRVSIELARRGYQCVGVDIDSRMLAVAAASEPDLTWIESDLSTLALDRRFDLVVAAGNVVPLLAPGTEATALSRLASHLVDGGALIAGFGLDAAHLPLDQAPFTIAEYDRWCAAAGLVLVDRFATWDRAPFEGSDGGYAVSVHRRPAPA